MIAESVQGAAGGRVVGAIGRVYEIECRQCNRNHEGVWTSLPCFCYLSFFNHIFVLVSHRYFWNVVANVLAI